MKELFNPGDKVKVITGNYKNRTGEFIKNCSSVFPEYCRIKLDLKSRERTQKIVMIQKSEIELSK